MQSLRLVYAKCRKSETWFLWLMIRMAYYKLVQNKTLLLHQNCSIKGIQNLHTSNTLEIGVRYVGFMHRKDRTLLNINGTLSILGKYSIGRGCRIDIGKDAKVTIGEGGYMNSNTKLIIMHSLAIGKECVIAWDCQFLDEDFHTIAYEGKRDSGDGIVIGNNVWIANGVKIYKGTSIPNGCVLAANSVVKGVFEEENCLIGGHPAKIIRRDIQWN
ncbi:MAG: hypothetical protein CFE21_11085 [Bacteroidetes bacterium B1(2017)]|nr:MAG: hypothetical protein CFE21_11085 [Bacteroidetes bacterium B1(2017)]